MNFQSGHLRTLARCSAVLLQVILLGPSLASCCQLPDTPMSLSGFSPSQAYEIADGGEVDLHNPFLVRLLHRVEKISKKNVDHFASHSANLSLSDIKEYPRKYRLWMFKVSGRVKNIRKYRYPDAERDDALKGCYDVEVVTSGQGTVRVVCRSIPRAWDINVAVDFPTSFYGFFLKHLGPSEEELKPENSLPLFVANRLAWFPDEVDATRKISASHVLLSQHGVDFGQFDFVRQRNTQSLGEADSESFYQILKAASEIKSLPAKRAGFLDLMRNPKQQFGNAVTLTANSRRCVKIEVTDADIRNRYGLDRYFELDMFIPIDGKVVVNSPAGPDLIYENRYPITVCLANLPAGMDENDLTGKKIEVSGFFYRFWKYKSEFTDQANGVSGQVSPLIVAMSPTVIETSSRILDIVLVSLLLGTIVIALGLVFWFRQSDRTRSLAVRSAQDALPDRVDLGGIKDNLDD